MDLPSQRFKIGIALLVPEFMQEFDIHTATIDRFIEIEYEHLQQWLGVRFDRGANAETGDPRARCRPEAVHANPKMPLSAGLWRKTMLAVGKPRLAPSLSPCATRPEIA